MVIYLGADYAGYALKEQIKKHLLSKGVLIKDVGCRSAKQKNDFPTYALPVARHVSNSKVDRGILICLTGMGMCIAANRFKHVRAALVQNVRQARWSRTHDDCNILCLATRITKAKEAKAIVDVWLKTTFPSLPRRVRRFRRIDTWRT